MHAIVIANGPRDAVKSRLACKPFATAIQHDMLYEQPLDHFFKKMRSSSAARLQDMHGAEMVAARLTNSDAPVCRYIQEMIDTLIRLKGIDATDQLHE